MTIPTTKPKSAAHGIPLGVVRSDKPLLVKWGGEPLIVVKHGSEYHALAATCTHLGGPLKEGLVENGQIRCPWHHARFCLKTGAAVGAPAFAALTRFKTRIEGDRIIISKAPGPPRREKLAESTRRVVVVGAGASGYACADRLLKLGFNGALTLLNADRDKPYDRTFCSKQYLSGEKQRADCFLPGLKRFADAQHTLGRVKFLRQKVTAIDVGAKAVALDSGNRVGFDILVLANGAEPQRPSIPGLDGGRAYVLRTLRDADHIIKQAKTASAVAVLGTSFIGLEAAAALRQKKLKVHVVGPDEVPLIKNVGKSVGTMIQQVHQKHGIVFHLGRKLKAYADSRVTLDDGSSFQADFIVLGTGVKPCTELAKGAGLTVAPDDEGGGVVVDERLQTSVPGIFAIGDISRYPNHLTGNLIRVEHWVHAQRQGQFVAGAIMGQTDAYQDVPFFWSAHFDTTLSYLGHVEKPKHHMLKGSIKKQKFAMTFSDGAAGEALLTCDQDLTLLRAEARWERPSRKPPGTPKAAAQ